MTFTKAHLLQLTAAVWTLCSLWNTHLALAAPMPQQSSEEGGGYPANDTSLNDPFSTPDYLAPTKFTWANCIYGLLFLFFGGVEVLHGYKYIRFTMLVAGFFIWASTAVMIMILVDTSSGKYQTSAVYFAVWFIIGVIGGLVSFYLWHVGIILTGAYGTFVLVAIVFTAANVESYVLRYTLLAVCLVLGGYMTKKYERIAVILATSIGGAYCMMFGLDMFVQTGFRATFHVILSQSTAKFHPVVGTWVMIACVPVIAIFGIIWELKHHEEPIGSWWFGGGARPLPPLPGEKSRRCCGMTLAAKPAKPAPSPPGTPGKSEKKRRCCGGGGGEDKKTTEPDRTGCCAPLLCCGKRRKADGTKTNTTATAAGGGGGGGAAQKQKKAEAGKVVGGGAGSGSGVGMPLPVEKAHIGIGHETIGHTGFHKVVIQKEVREFSMEIDERW